MILLTESEEDIRSLPDHHALYGAQNEVYNDDWVKSGLIVLYFS